MLETASFHIVKPCNMKCKFCYATFEDMHVGKELSFNEAADILNKLSESGLQKITFAGGEPLLYKLIKEVIQYAHSIDLTTSIITNGSLLTDEWLEEMKSQLDWIGISVDSLSVQTMHKIGRVSKGFVNYGELIAKIKASGYRLKINTVVNSYNKNEDMNDFITLANPDRWKVFQALRVEGQNDKQFEEIQVTESEYWAFIERHKNQKSIVAEDNAAMTGSYLLIDPQGRLFENSKGKHTYSQPLQTSNVATCLKEIELDRAMFLQRGGVYEW